MQPGDVPKTFADIDPLITRLQLFSPSTDIKFGIQKFIHWFNRIIHNEKENTH